jgi:FixJ family two-component response regulator
MVKHILIVDDQHEIRRMLRAGIETLGPEFQVLDLPSAEESLVVISIQPVHLLVTDIRLPGMSGLELMEKVRKRNPGLKVILITGLPDPDIRRQVAEAGAEAFFIKPVQMAAFLDAVEKAIGEIEVLPPAIVPSLETTQPIETLPERLANLRQELETEAVVLLDEWGKIVAQAGELPGSEAESLLIPHLLSAISAGIRLSISLDNPVPENLLFIKGSRHSLCAVNAGLAYALLVLVKSNDDFPGPVVEKLHLAVQGLLPLLEEPLSSRVTTQPPVVPAEDESEIPQIEEGKLEEILSQESAPKFLPQELDQFWESLADDSLTSGSSNASVISYEQARKLGLAPEDS